jgi:hypothetical protein
MRPVGVGATHRARSHEGSACTSPHPPLRGYFPHKGGRVASKDRTRLGEIKRCMRNLFLNGSP